MNNMQRVLVVTVIVGLAASVAYAAPKDTSGKGHKQDKKEQAPDEKIENENKANGKEQRVEKQTTAAVERQEQKVASKETKAVLKEQTIALKAEKALRHEQAVTEKRLDDQELMTDLKKVLDKLDRSRWWTNPHNDTSDQQGNMGKTLMYDPYGRDKESERLEYFGNRGRKDRENMAADQIAGPQQPPF